MNILVCVKDVPDPSAFIEIASDNLSFRIESSAPYVMSSLDEQALELALTIKDSCPGVSIHVLAIGADRSLPVLRRALGMGADKAILGSLPDLSLYEDPLVVASAIAFWSKTQRYSLYLLGAASDDLMQGQVGPMLAELMGLPCATCVVSVVAIEEEAVRCVREVDGGLRSVLEVDLPAVITVLSSQRTPRYPSLSNMLRAKKMPPERFNFDEALSLDTQRLEMSYHYPAKERNTLVLEGDAASQADRLIEFLRGKGLL